MDAMQALTHARFEQWMETYGRASAESLVRLRIAGGSIWNGDENPRLILVEVGEYWLDSARFRIDVDEFNSALAQAHAATSISRLFSDLSLLLQKEMNTRPLPATAALYQSLMSN
ncbi:MAG: hypothetical protein HFACDABA_02623 [Anaerolineales bacterium]|nr:hypothetical protein [Anaerolineales bacterium]